MGSAHKKNIKYSASLDQSIKGKTIGIPREFFSEGLEPEIKAANKEALLFLVIAMDIK